MFEDKPLGFYFKIAISQEYLFRHSYCLSNQEGPQTYYKELDACILGELSIYSIKEVLRKDRYASGIGDETLPARFFSRPKSSSGFFLTSVKEQIPNQRMSVLIKKGGRNERLHL